MAKILIADDASFMRGSLKYIMENSGHEVVGMAKDGGEAVELYRKLRPDIVTLDILMGDMDGMKALRAIRNDDPAAKVIMITAIGLEGKQREAEELGASGYIRKPFKPEDIKEEISRVIGEDGE
jgi:two-component system chemotaxis response regulator CheY